MKEKARQHYVPQFYLKLFSTEKNGNCVYCYDKENKRAFKTNVKALCSEIGFYENANKPNKPIEEAFSIQEGECSRIFRKVIGAEDMRVLTQVELAEFLGFLVLFKQRTRKRRDIVSQARKIWLDDVNSKFTDWKVVPKIDNWEQNEHLLSMVDFYEEETKQLLKNNWVLVVNKTKTPFWTSDDPIVQQFIRSDKRFSQPYMKFNFVLTPRILIFSEPLIGNNIRLFKTEITDESMVNDTNYRLTFRNAYRFVVSSEAFPEKPAVKN